MQTRCNSGKAIGMHASEILQRNSATLPERAHAHKICTGRPHNFSSRRRLHAAALAAVNYRVDAKETLDNRKPQHRQAPRWRVRKLTLTDVGAVTQLQTTAFHERQAIGIIDKLAFNSFRAEVKDGLFKKLQLMGPVFVVLVAEPTSHRDPATEADPDVVGVIEVAIGTEMEVLQHLPEGTQSYSYISSMAVADEYRRQGIATELLREAELVSINWNHKYSVLHVYEDNESAVRLYEQRGFRAQAKDPGWKKWLGGRVRILMIRDNKV